MPKNKKGVSLKKVAKTYRSNRTKPQTQTNGSRYFDENAKPYAIGSTESKSTYKPKARAGTFGVEGGTKRVRKNRAL